MSILPDPLVQRPVRPTRIHFLHPGKTGGTAIKAALAPIASERGLVLHPHSTVLADIPEGEFFFFFIRHPMTRFVSAFNSRLRSGRPRLDVKWNSEEAAAFSRFATPDALAVALSADDPAVLKAAKDAMRGIRHVNSSYADWFGSEPYLSSRLAFALFIGLQEHLAADFDLLKQRLRLPGDLALPRDPFDAHRTPPGFSKTLSDAGRGNLRKWYARDLRFYRFMRDLRDRTVADGPEPPLPQGRAVMV